MRRRLTTLLLAASVASGMSACNGGEPCQTDSDCFSGEVCSAEKICSASTETSNNGTTSNNGIIIIDDDDAGATTDPEMGNGDAGSVGTDAGEETDMGGDPPDLPAPRECVEDPFTATCDLPDDNDDFSDYVEIDSDCGREDCGPPGCGSSGDDFLGGSVTITDVQMCVNEHTDKYDTNLIPCDNKSFVVEATLRPLQSCEPDLYVFDMSVQGFDCADPYDDNLQMDRVRCEELADGSKRITAIVQPSNSIASAFLRVEEFDEPNVTFDYEIDIVVRE